MLGADAATHRLLAVYLRHRQYGYYFHFKLLAFVGPLVMVIAADWAHTVPAGASIRLDTGIGWSAQ